MANFNKKYKIYIKKNNLKYFINTYYYKIFNKLYLLDDLNKNDLTTNKLLEMFSKIFVDIKTY